MMRQVRGLTLLWSLGVAVILGSGLGCRAKGESYTGRWECASGRSDFFEIKANQGSFLVTDENGHTFPASVDDKGTLVMSGIPMMGSLPLPIDSSSGELICSVCKCNRYTKKSNADPGQGAVEQNPIHDKEAQKRTVADLRNVGTAMFSWLTDQVGAGAAGQSQTSGESKTISLTQYPPISRKEARADPGSQVPAVTPRKGWLGPSL